MLVHFLERYSLLIEDVERSKKNKFISGNSDLIRKILKKLDSSLNENLKNNFSKNEDFREFKNVFENKYKLPEDKYSKAREEEEERSLSIIINDNPFNFIKKLSTLSNEDDSKGTEIEKSSLKKSNSIMKQNRIGNLLNLESSSDSSDEDEEVNVFSQTIRAKNKNCILPKFEINEDFDENLDDLEEDEIISEDDIDEKNNNESRNRKRDTKRVFLPQFQNHNEEEENDEEEDINKTNYNENANNKKKVFPLQFNLKDLEEDVNENEEEDDDIISDERIEKKNTNDETMNRKRDNRVFLPQMNKPDLNLGDFDDLDENNC